MHFDGLFILIVPAVGLFPILRGGRWNWQVAKSSNLLNVLFWIGWLASLIVGIMRLFGVS